MRTLIFDFDGTIADSFELAVDIVYKLTGLQPIDADEVERLRRLPLLKAARRVGVSLRSLPRLLLLGRKVMHERMDEVAPFPGIIETLRALHETGHHMLIMSSNSEQNVRTFLRSNDIELYFSGVYGGVGLFNKAVALRKIVRRNGLKATECFYIGDEVRDMVAATKVGMKPVAVAWGYQAPEALVAHGAFVLVRTPPELIEVFEAEKV